jgi:hypothetical protein
MAILGAQPVTRVRHAAGSRAADGRWTRGASTSTTILASVQPPKGRQLQRLPEGIRAKVTLVAYSESEIRTGDQVGGVDPDELVYLGETFLVEAVERWSGVLPHYEAYLTRKNQAGGAP